MSDIVELGTVWKDTTPLLQLTLRDEDGTAIPSSSLGACTLDLYDEATGTTINSRSAVDVLSSVSAGGVLSFRFLAADIVLVGTVAKGSVERHIAHVAWTYATIRQGHFNGRMAVKNFP